MNESKNKISRFTVDDAIREILEVIEANTENNVIQSYHKIGEELKKMGISTKKMRYSEWSRIKNGK